MSDLSEYAKREAERKFPLPESGVTAPLMGWEVRQRVLFDRRGRIAGAQWGILHLAEQLQREDVIKEGARSIRATITESPEKSWNHHARVALAAMLARLAEGAEP